MEGEANDRTAVASNAGRQLISPTRAGLELFLISGLLLFLELACIRWFPAHVLFLTFFTNTILLACFLGMSVGCLAAERAQNFLTRTPALLVLAMVTAHVLEFLRSPLQKVLKVGNSASPEHVFFGTENLSQDVAHFFIPIEAIEGFFFLILALALIGPGQELGRALDRVPNRVRAYTLNILGSVAGIVLFAFCAWWELAPLWWFLAVAIGTAYFLFRPHLACRPVTRGAGLVCLGGVLGLASLTSGGYMERAANLREHLWSPYYRIDYERIYQIITVNLLSHQQMVSRNNNASPAYAYALPYILNRDVGGRSLENVLIIGAGSGNDVSRALEWGARHVDAVEIDPAILRLGRVFHPDHPYWDQRVSVHLDDGRNFLRSTDARYGLIVYALVDSLVLHSSYSNIRLESYLFTRQAFADVRRHLSPGGVFVIYNYFRQGWIVARLYKGLTEVFGTEPMVLTLPPRPIVEPEMTGGFTMFLAGDVDRLRRAFQRQPEYWLRDGEAPGLDSPNGFEQDPKPEDQLHWRQFFPAQVRQTNNLRTPSDDWPFLYLHRPMIPGLSVRGMIVMGSLSLLLLLIFLPKPQGGDGHLALDGRMFFLGAGFMLVETKAVVHMALLFGSTWMVNTVVFLAVLIMILAANLFVLKVRPEGLARYYAGLLAALALNCLVPLDFFLGTNRGMQLAGSSLLVFSPILFAGVIFAVSFGRSSQPHRDFGANVAGAILGGLAEYSSMLLGFQYLMVLAIVFYGLSAVFGRKESQAGRGCRIAVGQT